MRLTAQKVFNVHEHCGFRNGRFWYDKLWVIYRRAGEDAEEREAAFIAHFPVYSRVYDKEAEDQKEIRKREVVYVERKPPTLVDMVATMRELHTPTCTTFDGRRKYPTNQTASPSDLHAEKPPTLTRRQSRTV